MFHFDKKTKEQNLSMPTWPPGRPIPGIDNVGSPPFSISYNGTIYLFWIGCNVNHIFYSTCTDGENWNEPQPINDYDTAFYGISACIFNGHLYLFWTASNGSGNIYYSILSNGSWSYGQAINSIITTDNVVACHEFNSYLFLFWRASDGSGKIWFAPSSDGFTWPIVQRINAVDTTSDSPDANLYNKELYLFFKANDDTNRMLYTSSSRGFDWPPAGQIGSDYFTGGAISSNGAVDDSSTLLLVWRDTSDICNIMYAFAHDGNDFYGPRPLNDDKSSTTDHAPCCCLSNRNDLNAFWCIGGGTQMYTTALRKR